MLLKVLNVNLARTSESMKYYTKKPAVLMLKDGSVFHGSSIGKKGTSGGEVCFNTSMTGYQEVYTDPSYFGQVVVNTTAHIGNYGVVDLEQESAKPTISGLVVHTFSTLASRKTASDRLQEYLDKHNIVGIADVDTRQLVRHIRTKGAMNCIISSEILDLELLRAELDKVPDMDGLELASQVSTRETYELGPDDAGKRIAVLDLGIKKSIMSNLTERGCKLKVFPATTPYEEIAKWQPDGYFISNGPGDPGAMPYAVETVKSMLESNKPLFGICLGHQVLGLAVGANTYKMHHGHRGANQPVKNLVTGRSEITSQNHGFAVKSEDIIEKGKLKVTHVNLNDGTVEGFEMNDKPAFSVQYHPESSPGPHDSRYLFDHFIELLND
jgi:carbamoyl-phosphate synthase small subunit